MVRCLTLVDDAQGSANALVEKLMRAQPSYIRTIKPNENKSPTEYNSAAILHQIKYLGLQENIRIRRAGFAYRNTFEKMVQRCARFRLEPVSYGNSRDCFFPLAASTSCRRRHRTLVNTRGKATRDRAVNVSCKTLASRRMNGRWAQLKPSSRIPRL